jgi:hypothetical protein
MKNLIFGIAIVAITLAACSSNGNKSAESQNRNKDTQAKSQIDNTTVTTSSVSNTKDTVAIKEIISQYLQIKNGLANDNGKDAANAGKAFVESIVEMDKTSLTAEKKKIWDDISDDAKEMAEHIGANADKLEHQREHFEMLSRDMYDLVKIFGGGQVLYKDADTMYNNGKGAFWLSETKGIKNPYMGKAMSDSGSIKEEIK